MRCHVIDTGFALEAAEGAFAVPSEAPGPRPCDSIPTAKRDSADYAVASGALGSTGIYAVCGYERGEVIVPEPNTNIMSPRTLIPTLHAQIQPGRTRLVCAVFAAEGGEAPDEMDEEVLKIAKQCL